MVERKKYNPKLVKIILQEKNLSIIEVKNYSEEKIGYQFDT